ncbi:hypothetical protein [Rhodococcus sp. IEGM 1330]|uniref:hypothetical protein n=1 Tax=Rhodococcus sp. IEGM 1330 TaxID=3082225 RepID=UPI002952FA87|nr:hypothetical protein [Rhodococcus sp. IEGM 1330]MDV8024975.1 hypothetical protein [Rhodococcus sp. IEGM 1330]
MKIRAQAEVGDRPQVDIATGGDVTISVGDVRLVMSQSMADQLIEDIMLAIASRNLGSPLLRDEEAIRMNAFVRENL